MKLHLDTGNAIPAVVDTSIEAESRIARGKESMFALRRHVLIGADPGLQPNASVAPPVQILR
jgi:hypothetical protein